MDNGILLTDSELAILTRHSTRERFLLCTFGPGWVRLDRRPENAWAIEAVEAGRAQARKESQDAS